MRDFEQDTPINEPECGYLSEAELDAMTVEELEAALALALDSMTEETYDGDVISRYLDALERKAPMPPVPDVDASYSAFLQKMQAFTPERRTRNRWKRPGRVLLAAILAVIAVFGSLFTAQALGADVFGKLAQWTDEFFNFGSVQAAEDPLLRYSQAGAVDEIARSVDTLGEDGYDTATYTSLQDALDAYGISDVPLVPGWMPEGFELNYMEVYYSKGSRLDFFAQYTNGEFVLLLNVTLWDNPSDTYTYFKDDEQVSVFESGGITHYLLSNNSATVGAWNNGAFECSISGAVSQKEMRNMIISVYGG